MCRRRDCQHSSGSHNNQIRSRSVNKPDHRQALGPRGEWEMGEQRASVLNQGLADQGIYSTPRHALTPEQCQGFKEAGEHVPYRLNQTVRNCCFLDARLSNSPPKGDT